ncbi:Nramp family divalent metal transporter [Arthrobacter sp. AL08]|uniref:Nramp family divalent metal transporter n=1 Tax=unclassified Arthrobacter TaxID=235627 RepID=UPI00249ADFFB|nr:MULTISPECIES: Nramp family divalent metal transporter [unclassified Arthrobacter]MCB5281750.1 Divalent metal cation transporter MntH [Arthrobacter sp. ES1]MDI3242650.1 Nramp family divalent metal transporter [Arthrobacter sp. AL05]MDI3278619.1 Nramp family divalent metal transporter [Arthrobacter sp. AL08]WGZ78405.1 Nramp family divalent metal transporter [Arthrobacter sp. EM1]
MLDVTGHDGAGPATAARPKPAGRRAMIGLLGPAFVAAIAYVDPGNVAANLTAGAQYGYLLVWVLVAANIMAVLVQYQSAKLGLVTGKSLPEILGERLKPFWRRAFWVQAEIVAAATDLAEVVGGAIALFLLFGLPLPLGAVIVGAVSMGLLAVQARNKQRPFEFIIIFLLGIITIGFLAGLFVSPPDPAGVAAGLIPGFRGPETVLLAASMLGATVMPHAIYVHSALSRDRHRPDPHVHVPAPALARLVKATRWDVVVALAFAGLVNIGMLLLAASTLGGADGTDTIEGAHAAITSSLGPVIGVIFAVGLLASGLASTSVGCYAGGSIMEGLLKIRVPLMLRRIITLVPAVVLLSVGFDPTWGLVLSQVVLSFGIPFVLIPLVVLTSNKSLMGRFADGMALRIAAVVSVILVVALNLALLWLTFASAG